MRSCTLLLVWVVFVFAAPALAEEQVAAGSAAESALAESGGAPVARLSEGSPAAEPVVLADGSTEPVSGSAIDDPAMDLDNSPSAPSDAESSGPVEATRPTLAGPNPPAEVSPPLAALDSNTESPASTEGGGLAEAGGATEPNLEASPDGVEWDQFVTSDRSAAEPVSDSHALHAESQPARADDLGPKAVDEHGHRGRIHTVVRGDTLWDVSTAYLGTPWVWPSIWQDNGEIENPHLIVPGERIFVTAGEMRKVSREQAEDMIAADNTLDTPVPTEVPADLEPSWDPIEEEDDLMAADIPAAMDHLPVEVPLEPQAGSETGRTVRVAEREVMGFVSSRAVDAATSIVDSPSPRTWLVDGDIIYLGMGEGHVDVGDEFTIFRDAEPVRDTENGRLLGYHVDILGWAIVREVEGESATAEIRMSESEIQRTDRVIPRERARLVVPIKSTPDGINGKIVFMPDSRTSMGDGDYVYLNRGELHGFEVGSAVEVFTPGRLRNERVSGDRIMTPDHVIARMVLVEVKPDTSVAFVVRAVRELEIGDRVRASPRRVASR